MSKMRIHGHEIEDVDPGMVKLVELLNRVPGVSTYSSCEGHRDPEPGQSEWGCWCVSLDIDETPRGWRLLELLAEVAIEMGPGCILKAWRNAGSLSWSLEGRTEECSADQFATALRKRAGPLRPSR